MGAKVALNKQQYEEILQCIIDGFVLNGKKHRPNPTVAYVLMMEGNLGIRCGDVLLLTYNSFKQNGDSYVIDIIEEKTKKKRTFEIDYSIYNFLTKYVIKNKLDEDEILFKISIRQVQNHLKKACEYLGYKNISTHSFRKYAATKLYKESGYDIELVRKFLQHESTKTTQKYLGVTDERMKKHTKAITEMILDIN